VAIAAAQHARDLHRDLVIKDEDLIVGTHGRGFGFSTTSARFAKSRRTSRRRRPICFRPPVAWRFRWNKNTDTPLPPDEPAAPNPPDGVTSATCRRRRRQAPGGCSMEILDANVTGEIRAPP
jgi:hypothetical protein